MKQKFLYVLGLAAAASLGLGEGPAWADATAPYYAMPSWDQQLPASKRFVVLSNWIDVVHPLGGAAVLDKETGLVWEQSPSTLTFSWAFAQAECNFLTTGGRLAWRLPTVQELASLVDPGVPPPGPKLPSGHPFSDVQSDIYWSATTYDADTTAAWVVSFTDGSAEVRGGKSNDRYVWCVRGGQGVDPQ
jgi:hypothetical protein